MGRLPTEFAKKQITMRYPYEMAGELILAGSQSGVQFPDAMFQNNIDMPFECHRMIPRITGLNSSGNVMATQPSQDLMQELVRVRIVDFGKNVVMTKNPTLLNTLTKGSSERTWEWADPYYLIRSEGFQVSCDTLVLPVFDGNQIPVTPVTMQLTSLRIEIVFEGFMLQIAPPSNVR